MARRLPDIRTDSRYRDFCIRYRHRLLRYAIEVSGINPTWQQAQLFKAIEKPGSRVACSSGHGTGKSVAYSVTCDWHLRVYPMSNTLLTANNIEQVRSIVWKEMGNAIRNANERFPWMAPYFIKETKRYYVRGFKDEWFVLPKTAPKHKAENIAGMHNRNYLVLVDEASAIEDNIMTVLRGALTEDRNRFAMVSQYTRLSGHFNEAFTTLQHIYTCLQFNSEESPLVSKAFIQEKLDEYGGHHSPEYQIRVLGRRPDNLSGFLIPLSWCEEAQKVKIEHVDDWGWMMTVDVGEGVYRDSSVYTVGKVSGYMDARMVEPVKYEETLNVDPKRFAREVWVEAQNYPDVVIAVDSDGPGLATALELEELGANVVRIHWGRPPHAQEDKKRYQDQRAYACVQARKAVFEGRMKLVPGKRCLEQASRIPYEIDRRGRYVIMPKAQMKSLGIKSPDIFDTHCFFFLVDFIPVGGDGRDQDRDEMQKWAADILKGED